MSLWSPFSMFHFQCGLCLVCQLLVCSNGWRHSLEQALFEKHGLKHDVYLDLFMEDFTRSQQLGILCRSFTYSNRDSFRKWQRQVKKSLIPYHVKKSTEKMCFLGEFSEQDAKTIPRYDSNTMLLVFPTLLKIHQSVIDYVRDIENRARGSNQNTPIASSAITTTSQTELTVEESAVLSVEFSPFALERSSIRELSSVLFGTAVSNTLTGKESDSAQSKQSKPGKSTPLAWELLSTTHGDIDSDMSCDVSSLADVHYHSRTVDVVDLSRLSLACLVHIVNIASQSNDVIRVTVTPRPVIMNYEARSVIQSGSPGSAHGRGHGEPYRAAGLRGQGQVVGVSDSGLSDLSCFHVDDSGKYDTIVTSREGVIEPERRKVIQYTPYADAYDARGGHGTHVCGTIAGNSLNGEFHLMNGVAPDAKISFFDVGMTDRPFLKTPPLDMMFVTAYNASARVHSNSWGSTIGIYTQNSYDVDKFTYTHDDSLVLFACGNSGQAGLQSIISPSNSKNGVAVGAGELRSVYEDEITSASNYTVAYFSSLGPTADGRIKPDIIAPGDVIVSAYAGDVDVLKRAVDKNEGSSDRDSTCAVHQLEGTSMATPLVSGSALLIRQYFMDSAFWATLCRTEHRNCKGGAFTPSGYLLKTLILHSGQAVPWYSRQVHDSLNTLSSFPLGAPPDYFQGYGELVLSNILPLHDDKGLDPSLDLVVFDRLEIEAYSTVTLEIDLAQRTKLSKQQQPRRVRSDELPPPTAADSKRQSVNRNLPLKITLCWYDPPSLVGSSSSMLIHDLDLIVEGPSGDIHAGNMNGAQFNAQEALRGRGTRGGRLKGLDYIVTDENNPNEQVTVMNPGCDAYRRRKDDACVYKVYVQSYALPANRTQRFALVITTEGSVSEPSSSEGVTPYIPLRKRSDFVSTQRTLTNDSITVATSVIARLKNNEYVDVSVSVDTCAELKTIVVDLQYDAVSQRTAGSFDGRVNDQQAAKMYLTLVDPEGETVIIGQSFNSAESGETVEEREANFLQWPPSWDNHSKGQYTARFNLPLTATIGDTQGTQSVRLYGVGNWTLRLWNGGSSDSIISMYNVTVSMRLDTRAEKNIRCKSSVREATTKPVKEIATAIVATAASPIQVTPTVQTTPVLVAPISTEVVVRVIPINSVKLGVHLTPRWTLRQDKQQLDSFTMPGLQLSSVALELASSTTGMDAWLLAAMVYAPNGLAVQVGGFQWLGQDNHFYSRRWPDTWMGMRSNNGVNWHARRDVYDAELHSAPFVVIPPIEVGDTASDEVVASKDASETWTVSLAMGYSLTIKPAVTFNGNLTLTFVRCIPSAGDESTPQQATSLPITPPIAAIDGRKVPFDRMTVNRLQIFLITSVLASVFALVCIQLCKRRRHMNSIYTIIANMCATPIHFCTRYRPIATSLPTTNTHSGRRWDYELLDLEENFPDTQYSSRRHQWSDSAPVQTTLFSYQQGDKDDTRSLIHAFPKSHKSECDLPSIGQQRISKVHHVSGKELYKQQQELMPLARRIDHSSSYKHGRNRSRTDSTISSVTTGSTSTRTPVSEASPMFVRLKPKNRSSCTGDGSLLKASAVLNDNDSFNAERYGAVSVRNQNVCCGGSESSGMTSQTGSVSGVAAAEGGNGFRSDAGGGVYGSIYPCISP